MRTKNANIDKVMKKLGIKKLSIPDDNLEGKTYRFRILNAASDPKPERAEEKLKAIIQEMIKEFPEFVKTWEDKSKNKADAPVSGENIDDFITPDNEDDEPIEQPVVNSDELTIIIDKKDLIEKINFILGIDYIPASQKARDIVLQNFSSKLFSFIKKL